MADSMTSSALSAADGLADGSAVVSKLGEAEGKALLGLCKAGGGRTCPRGGNHREGAEAGNRRPARTASAPRCRPTQCRSSCSGFHFRSGRLSGPPTEGPAAQAPPFRAAKAVASQRAASEMHDAARVWTFAHQRVTPTLTAAFQAKRRRIMARASRSDHTPAAAGWRKGAMWASSLRAEAWVGSWRGKAWVRA